MKAMVCEMCNSNDIVKQDGLYVCQACGTKYTVEEAKKLMIEGPVDVSGSTIKLDNSDNLNNLYELAHRAKSTGNIEDAKNYYGQIVQMAPNSWEAYFYSVYFSQLDCKIYQIGNAARTICNTIKPTFELIDQNVADTNKQAAYEEVAKACCDAAYKLLQGARNHYLGNMSVSGAKLEFKDRADYCIGLACNVGHAFYDRGESALALKYYHEVIGPLFSSDIDPFVKENVESRIKALDPSYVPTKTNGSYSNSYSKSGGCYVATAIYGSYNCPEVWTLRRYRDYNLAETWYGRAFIHAYYAVSPLVVKHYGNTAWFKKFWRTRLDKMVKQLQEKGYESSPYEDRNWR